MARYWNPHEFPYESFVQAAVVAHLERQGFVVEPGGHVDIVCSHSSEQNKTWHIEAKGKTSAIGLDFNTALGQLVKGMDRPDKMYAIALPDIPQFRAQVAKVRKWVVAALNLKWIWVGEDGTVVISEPPLSGS